MTQETREEFVDSSLKRCESDQLQTLEFVAIHSACWTEAKRNTWSQT